MRAQTQTDTDTRNHPTQTVGKQNRDHTYPRSGLQFAIRSIEAFRNVNGEWLENSDR